MAGPTNFDTAQKPTRWFTSPAAFWATLSAVSIVVSAWVIIRWIVDGGFTSASPESFSISSERAAVVWIFQAASVLMVGAAFAIAIRGCRKAGQVTLDAALLLGFALSTWLDPLMNIERVTVAINRYALHVPSWGSYIPGWDGPPHQIVGLIAPSGLLYSAMIYWVWIGSALLRHIAKPSWGPAREFLAGALILLVWDVCMETIMIFCGILSYSASYPPLTLFSGHWYQLPLISFGALSLAATFPSMMLRYYAGKNNGEPLIFRGLSPAKTWKNAFLRLSAGVGFTHLSLLFFMLVTILHGYIGSDMPEDTPGYLWPR